MPACSSSTKRATASVASRVAPLSAPSAGRDPLRPSDTVSPSIAHGHGHGVADKPYGLVVPLAVVRALLSQPHEPLMTGVRPQRSMACQSLPSIPWASREG